ncbi:LysR family transcriptional regulator [Paraburkholderia solisilvae]|uniref:HTH-type transcriptional regulator DmlR n=1 Tax=Paraburkholderia solisilvae TaxID=624376 RepID=A0A6J5ET17_9BURK|nr:LysR family transcriptional regulator [Paraburkholderia solisilvae]CAB3769313.1 HTH-type transcriptional regulator DmlR [Paraburkholderia solisilvae]
MQLDDLKIFVTTVDARNFTAAADRLQLSKQFVSRRVMALEASLGVRLLVRNTRKLAVTDLGYEFYERASRILADVADAEQAMSSQRAHPRGLLRVSAPLSFGVVHLSPLVGAFLSSNPEVRIDIELSDRVVDVVGEEYDMALRIGTLADSTLIAQKLAEFRMIACCSPVYRSTRRLPMTPAELAGHPCLLYGEEARTGWAFDIDGAVRQIEVHGPLRANNGEVIRDAAIAGIGVALLPEFIVAGALASGQLVALLESFAAPPITLHAVYPQHRQSSVTIRAFTQFLREQFATALAA